jgi:amino acid transporter
MVGTIVLNTFAGLLTLVPMMFVLPNIDDLLALASGQPVPAIIKSAIGSPGGSFALLIPLLVLALICGIGCTTAGARCIWAFARDGAIPGSGLWKTVDKRLGVPLNAMMLSMVVQIILGLIYFGSTAAFNAFSGVGVICLTTSYAMPITVSLLNKREALKGASFSLGALGPVCNYIALGMSLSCSSACPCCYSCVDRHSVSSAPIPRAESPPPCTCGRQPTMLVCLCLVVVLTWS